MEQDKAYAVYRGSTTPVEVARSGSRWQAERANLICIFTSKSAAEKFIATRNRRKSGRGSRGGGGE